MNAILLNVFIVISMFGCIYSQTAKYESTDKWGTYKDGAYSVLNDVWGDGAGPQKLFVNSHKDWWIQANHPGSNQVKAYAHVQYDVNKKLSALKKLTSTVAVKVPSEGTFNSAYDIWADNHKYEIMIWIGAYGGAGPLGASVEKATIAGHSWDVHKGTNGANEVYSFIISSNISSGTIDILAVLNWIKTKGWFGDVTVGDVEYGWEIFDTKGKTLEYRVTNYDVTVG